MSSIWKRENDVYFQKSRRKTNLLDGGGVSVAVLAAAADVGGFVHGRCGFALAAA